MSKKLCGEQHEAVVFTRFAFGDPMPHNARFMGADSNEARREDALIVYVTCQREEGHAGRHLVYKYGAFEQEGGVDDE